MALFGTVGEKRAALIRLSGSEAAFAILARVVLFTAFCVVGGRRTRVRREAFGGIFFAFLAHMRRVAVPNRAYIGPQKADWRNRQSHSRVAVYTH